MEASKRFTDEDYKNWLKTAEGLYLLRRYIRDFVENETETYHKSLRDHLKGVICVNKCKSPGPGKKFVDSALCQGCQQWKCKILANHLSKSSVHFENCQPYLWPLEKWEVAKAYMPRTPRDHNSFQQFDISAILNFMDHCKHFRALIKTPLFSKVINVRNKVMHSPELRLSKKDSNAYIENVLQLAKTLEPRAPGLKAISEELKQFEENLEKYCRRSSHHAEDSKEDHLKLMNREHQALKEKIEFLAQHYEEQQNADLKKELQGMRNFLEQNKDLLENLGPHVNQLDEIQEKVNKHDQQIDNLEDRVDKLEKDTLEKEDTVFIGETLKFKNHLIEEARKRKWSDPVFTEVFESTGYRGRVEVNGRLFIGSCVCSTKKRAHQDVARQALESLELCDSNEELSQPGYRDQPSAYTAVPSVTPAASSSNVVFYATATVVLTNQEVVSDGCEHEEHAVESAYEKLAGVFGVTAPEAGKSFRAAVLTHFDTCDYPPPSEYLYQQGDKSFCKLLLCGPFTFHDKDGSIKKKQAEQQAAMVALQRLSGVLNCRSEDVKDGNYKGFLKEHLEAHGLQQPEYSNERKEVVTSEVEGLSTSTAEGSVAVLQPSAPTHQADDDDDEAHLTKPRDTHTPPIPRKVAKLECADVVFYATATVVLTNQEVVSDGCEHEEHAVESAYEKLAGVFGVTAPEAGKSFRAAVLTHFDTCHYTPPSEYLYQQGDKSFCKLLLCGPFTFHDKDGSIKKKQAEQQAAMVALQRLSGVLNCRSEDVKDGNYKGFLKEHLEAHGLQQPEYSNERKEVVTSEVEGPSTSTAEGSVAVLQPPAPTHQADDDDHDEAHLTEPQGTHTPPIPPSIPGSRENLDQRDEIYKLLTLFNLKPPSVIVESVRNEQNFCMKVEAILDNLTFKNKDPSTSKKDAVRKAYYVLGYALGICQSNTVSLQEATMLVKQDFSQKSLPHPKELIEGTKEPFYCSLTVISYRLVYEGQGSTEADAKLDVLQKALRALPVLFGYESLPSSSSAEETEAQINAVLRSKGQKDLALSLRRRHLCSATVLLKDYAMTSTGQSNKKGNRSDLSRRILGLLGEKTEPSCSSFRNLLDEWFRKRGLQLPVFEDTEEGQGSRTTLSLSLSCSHSDWEDSLEAACGKLIQELSERFRYLSE